MDPNSPQNPAVPIQNPIPTPTAPNPAYQTQVQNPTQYPQTQPIAPAPTPIPQPAPLTPKQREFLVFSYFSLENQLKYTSLVIRIGLAFVFIFAAYAEYINPETYSLYIPSFVTYIVPANLFLHVFGSFEVILAIWLLTGRFLIVSATLSFLTLFSLTFTNLGSFSILFRNVAIIFGSVGLMILATKPKMKQS